MAEFTSARSIRVLAELSPGLVSVNESAIKHIDYSLIVGARTVEIQQRMFAEGKSKLDGIINLSKHQITQEDPLAHAFDFIPAPFTGWYDRPVFTAYAHFIIGIGYEKGIKLRWGGDWDQDFRWTDQTFHDFPHIEEV